MNLKAILWISGLAALSCAWYSTGGSSESSRSSANLHVGLGDKWVSVAQAEQMAHEHLVKKYKSFPDGVLETNVWVNKTGVLVVYSSGLGKVASQVLIDWNGNIQKSSRDVLGDVHESRPANEKSGDTR